MSLLAVLARHGRWVLVAGLLLGTAWPALARAMVPAVVPIIGVMIFLSALRLGPAALLPRRGEVRRTLLIVLIAQLALPLIAAAVLSRIGWLETPAGLGTVLVLAGAPIMGAPGIALLTGADAAITLRQLAAGMVLLPATALAVFLTLPAFENVDAVLWGVLRLLGLIAGAGALAALCHRVIPRLAKPEAKAPIEGALTLAMGLVVIGLMSALGPALLSLDARLPGLMALVFALNLGAAAATLHLVPGAREEAAGLAVALGNRNLAVFLAGLPAETVSDLLLFVACYQIPMYLSPLLLPRLPGWPVQGKTQSIS